VRNGLAWEAWLLTYVARIVQKLGLVRETLFPKYITATTRLDIVDLT
jgi:hypothetical protein